jgi:PleD family two-component response regulator
MTLTQTDLKTAVEVAEKRRQTIANHRYSELQLSLTATSGSRATRLETGGIDILAETDRQLYRAKQSGRNQVAYAVSALGIGTEAET